MNGPDRMCSGWGWFFAPELNWRLVGVVYEGVMAQDFERITAVRPHFILPDGRLTR
jgi:hypothetical protein